MFEFQFKGCNISYQILGEGRPVVCLHGWGMDHRLMSGCMEPVFSEQEGYKRIYLDLPGMGQSKAGKWIYTSDDILEVLLAFLDAVVPGGEFILMGESYGGYLARGLVKTIPSRVAGLILLCPLVFPGYRVGRTVLPLEVKKKEESFLQTLSEEERAGFTYLNVIQTREVYERYQRDIADAITHQDHHFLDEVLDGAFSFSVDELEEPFKKPVLILVGKQDTEVGFEDQFDLLRNYPEGTYVAVNGAGHNLQIEKPRLFEKLIGSWLLEL